jgi:cAMP-binding proteins - catabolite gene activator and regulatory subunit of cAMP-dependent protein kinases
MKELTDFLLQFGNLNTQQIDLIGSKTEELLLKKDAYFSEAGKIPNQVGFILEGILRVCYYDNKGEEVTKYFGDENHLIVDWHHFEAKIPASEYVQAVTECKLLVFSRKDWEELSNTIIGWDTIVNKIIQKALIEKLDRRSPLVSEDATIPDILRKISLYRQSRPTFLYRFVFRRHKAVAEPNQEEHPLILICMHRVGLD